MDWTTKNYEAAFSDFTGTFPEIIFCVIMYNVSFYYAAVYLSFCTAFVYTGLTWNIELNLKETTC